jgi:hypothetical protein
VFTDTRFFVEYYKYLFSLYDGVVIPNQLSNPAFLTELGSGVTDLADRTILFLALGCGSAQMGRCVLP